MLQTLIIVGVWAAVLYLIARKIGGGRVGFLEWGAIVIFCSVVGWYSFVDRSQGPVDTATDRPVVYHESGYIGSQRCQECHESEHTSWFASYHRTMTTVAGPDTVKADWEATNLIYEGQSYRLFKDGERFMADFPDPDWGGLDDAKWPRMTREIVMVTGSHHMQVYWYPQGKDRKLRWFRFVWLLDENRWTTRDASFLAPPGMVRESHAGEWNFSCQRCHATHGRMRQDRVSGLSDTRVGEFGISCEACHGPGAGHAAAYDERLLAAFHNRADQSREDEIVNPETLGAERASQVCGQCHGVLATWSEEYGYDRWNENGLEFRPGGDLQDSRFLITRKMFDDAMSRSRFDRSNPDVMSMMYWNDGQIRVSGREYNGLVDSPCFVRGEGAKKLSCLSCHSMHGDNQELSMWKADQLRSGHRGNKACVSCHGQYKDPAVLVAHTHHAAESPGSNCYNCHMPYTTYGLLKAIRSHKITSPSVHESLRVGRPNACNQCHGDKTFKWAATHLNAWYEQPVPTLSAYQEGVPATLLWALSGDAGQRALAAWTMGWEPALQASGADWQARFLSQLLIDPYAAVRRISHRSLQKHSGYQEFEYEPVLSTPEQRASRAAAALSQWRQGRVDAKELPNALYLLDDPQQRLSDRVYDELILQRLDTPVRLSE